MAGIAKIITGLAAAVLLINPIALAEDMYLTLDDSTRLVLHADYTWDLGVDEDEKTIATQRVTLSDGKVLVITGDKRWGYVTDSGATTVVSTMYAIGVANRNDRSKALAAAMTEALKRLAMQLQPIAENPDVAPETLIQCLNQTNKAVETREDNVNGWRVTVRLTLDDDEIKAALSCSESEN